MQKIQAYTRTCKESARKMLLQPIFDYLTSAKTDRPTDGNFLLRQNSIRKRRRDFFPKYGVFSMMQCEAYITKAFGFVMDVVTGKRIVFVLSMVGMCWLMLFIRLSFIEVWKQTAIDSYRQSIEQQLSEMDSSLTSAYRHIRRLNPDRRIKVKAVHIPGLMHHNQAKRKIIIYSYKSAGASKFAEMFNQDPRAIVWYEILDPFYSSHFGLPPENYPTDVTHTPDMKRRDLDREERDWIADYIRRIFHCEPSALPVETLMHNHLLNLKLSLPFKECYMEQPIAVSIRNCTDIVEPICGHTAFHSFRRQCHIILEASRKLRHRLPSPRSLINWDLDVNNTEIFTNYLNNLLGEDVNLLSHAVYKSLPKFLGHQMCLNEVAKQAEPCMVYADEACSDKLIEVAQIERMAAEDLKLVLADYPHTQIVYHIRDPRAIAAARVKLYPEVTAHGIVEEAKTLCSQMLADYWEMVKLQNKYQHTSFIIVRYEDVVIYPYEVALETYNFLGMTTPDSYKMYVETEMLVNKAEYMFGSAGANRTYPDDLYLWQNELSHSELRDINRHCRDTLSVFQYSK